MLPYPPSGFECEYKNCCPHLNRISTTWVFKEYRRAEQKYAELWAVINDLDAQLQCANARIGALEEEKAEVQAKYGALQKGQFKAAAKRRKPKAQGPDSKERKRDGANDGPRKRGAPKGHPGWSRPRPERFDDTVEVAPPETCPQCHCPDLRASDEVVEHWQEDIVIVTRPVATLYRRHAAFCPKCRKNVVHVGLGESPQNHVGLTTQSTAIYLHHAIGLSYRKTQRVMAELFGMNYALASALAFDEVAVRKGKPLYEDLRDKLRTTSYIHADETHWRQDGQNHYVWFAGNPDLAFYHIDPHRSSDVATAILGEGYQGVLVTDGYAAYNAVNPKAHQSCLAHLIRKSEAVTAELDHLENNTRHNDAIAFCERIRDLLGKACALHDTPDTRTPQQTAILEQLLLARLEHLCAQPFHHKTTETFRKRLIGKEKTQWFTFLRHPEVPPTNNHAEQSIRPMVLLRKTSFGTRSPDGSARHSILPSLIQTAVRQGKPPREFIHTLLSQATPTAQAALYRNPP